MSVTAVPIRPISKGSLLKLWIGLAALAVIAAAIALMGTGAQRAADPATFLADNARQDGVVTTASGLQYKLLQAGSGPRPTLSDMVSVEYEGRLADGTMFESTADAGPATFPVIGVVPGFSEAVQLMQKGSKLRIWLAPDLAYGAEERRDPRTNEVVIPANSVLQFDLTLVGFQPLPPEQLEQFQMLKQQMDARGQSGS